MALPQDVADLIASTKRKRQRTSGAAIADQALAASAKKIRDTKSRTRRASAQGEGLKVQDPRTSQTEIVGQSGPRELAPYHGAGNIPLASSRYHGAMQDVERAFRTGGRPAGMSSDVADPHKELGDAMAGTYYGHPYPPAGSMDWFQDVAGDPGVWPMYRQPNFGARQAEQALSHRNPDMPDISEPATAGTYQEHPAQEAIRRFRQPNFGGRQVDDDLSALESVVRRLGALQSKRRHLKLSIEEEQEIRDLEAALYGRGVPHGYGGGRRATDWEDPGHVVPGDGAPE